MSYLIKFPRPRLLTFDAFGTLYTPDPSVEEQYSKFAKEHGVDVEPQVIKHRFKNAYKHISSQFPNYGKSINLPIKNWWLKIIKSTFSENNLPDELSSQLCTQLYDHFNTADAYYIYPDGMELIHTLGDLNFNMGILSNSDPRMRIILERTGYLKYLTSDNIFISYETGFEKPHKDAFELAANVVHNNEQIQKSSTLHNNQLWHVGDDVDKDYRGAFNNGWNTILVDRNGEFLDEKELLKSFQTLPGYTYYNDKGLTIVTSGLEPARVYTNDMSKLINLFI